MKFFLDANIPYSAVEIFKKRNFKCVHARDVGLSRANDEDIMEYAKRIQSILVTKDLEFANIKVFPIKLHYGVLVARLPPFFKAPQFINALDDFLSSINLRDLKKSISIVKLGRYRIRRFE